MSNNSTLSDNVSHECIDLSWEGISVSGKLYLAVTVMISVVAIVGNLLVILSVTLNRHMRTSSNYAMLNLAIGDLILMIITPILEFKNSIQPFQTSIFQCKFFTGFCITIQGVTIFTILSLSLDRYNAVAQPKSRSSVNPVNSLLFKLAIIWMVSVAFGVPVVYTANVRTDPMICDYFWCEYALHGTKEAIAYALIRFIFIYAIPMILVGLLYIMMAMKLTDQPATFSSSSGGTSRSQAARKHLAATVLVIAVLFAICWFPFNVKILVLQFAKSLTSEWIMNLTPVSTIFMYTNSCVNPIVLYSRSPLFKKYFKRYLFLGRVGGGHEYTITNDAGTTNITATHQTSETV